MVVQYLFVFLCFLIDGAIEACFNISFSMDHMYFVSCFGICGLVLTVRKMDFTDAIILSLLSGMFYDFFYTNSFLVYSIIFVILCIIVKAWTKHLGDSLLESIVICISALFATQLIVYGYMLLINETKISFYMWISDRMFLTIIINALFVFVLFFLTNIRDNYIKKKELRIRKEERLYIYKGRK
ncbi:rod shape-determining protein MreD [Breznakia sp. PF5-3]|uniref:hypothetical protein n=1 Tax=unclassified Breznakia TaxID=2623764 RepID=UPI002404E184|nr:MULTISPECIES: hypothetical protein [unclassified Breznakia]MDF9824127.1 rod shape-determining protein MreD [Breznakia sp. PM6-1]MDF9834925.1 rod shape-determining protein MreD [Breznakia sp. PF5-3]MDF9837206.1 rod shape-determining protein MreD [Breznakia sp. PFB2-8]MDF9859196.1 rod shape-determining protein MreD [Breznakia sp. PH5-24]